MFIRHGLPAAPLTPAVLVGVLPGRPKETLQQQYSRKEFPSSVASEALGRYLEDSKFVVYSVNTKTTKYKRLMPELACTDVTPVYKVA